MKSIKTLYLLIIPILLLAGITPTIGIAYADPPTPTSGDFLLLTTSDVEVRVTEGGITIMTYAGTWEMTGDVAGLLTCDERLVINPRTSEATYHSRCIFTGTVLDSDLGEARFVGDCTVENPFTPIVITECAFQIFEGTGGLTGVHWVARGGYTGDPEIPYAPYTGWAHFDQR